MTQKLIDPYERLERKIKMLSFAFLAFLSVLVLVLLPMIIDLSQIPLKAILTSTTALAEYYISAIILIVLISLCVIEIVKNL